MTVIKGKCAEVKPGEGPAGECAAKDCPLKSKDIIDGMLCVEVGTKKYHASCATRAQIKFEVPKPKKIGAMRHK